MIVSSRPRFAGAFRRAALPLFAYYAVTLALPLANGAAQSGSTFAMHAVIVLIVPPLLIVLAYAALRAVGALARVVRSALPVERSRARLKKRAIAYDGSAGP
jgi:hypothetical protein